MTAVEFLEKICNDRGYYLLSEYFEQAKEMEKEQHKKTWSEGMFCETGDIQAFEQYYNETFKNAN